MEKAHSGLAASGKGVLPIDAHEALQWFVNTFGLYVGSTRGLLITDWAVEREATLEAAIINLKSRGFNPLAITGDSLYKQADYLWKESRTNTQFGRPLASKLELEIGGSDIVVVDNLEVPENSRQLWYLYAHLIYPRAVAGKATIITTPLSYEELNRYGAACSDPDFCGKSINWEKLMWLIEASMIPLDLMKQQREEGLPPMLKAEYELYHALKQRGLEVIPQHVLGDFMLDFALFDKERRLNIETDTISSLGSSDLQRQEAKRNLVLFSDGWQVLKFTTGEILGNKAGCVDTVDDVWRSGRKRSSVGRLLTGNSVPATPDLPVDDDVQMSAITYGGGPAAVCGGAGTGKTTCVIHRVAYLLGQGVAPDNILVLTHGTDTQRALKRAIEAVVEKQAAQKLSVYSWQDLGLRILKENLPAIKRKPPLKIEPSPQKIVQRLLTKAKKEIDPAKLELSVDLDEFYIAAVISMYKAHLISPKQAKEDASNYSEEIIAKIYQQLEDQLQKANRIDRDDVIAMTVNVLLENQELRQRYQRQYEFVLIDEYQDVTVAQDMLGRLLAAPQDNLFLAGDEDETVCEAKNACPELFTESSLRLPHARCFVLERNWRSHPAIVDHARQLINGLQKRRVPKEYVSAWGQAPASAIVGPAALADEFDEANWVASEIQLLVESGRSYGDIAILFRHHVYATIMEEALDQRGVRYQSSNPINNFIPDEVEDMMAFLKLVMDPDGPRARESFERICGLRIKEIDPKLSGTIASFAEANNLSYLKAVEIYSEATSDQACRELEQLVRIIRTMHQEKLPPAETIALIRRTQRLNDYYRTVKVPAGVNYEPLKKLTQLEEESRNFKTIAEFVKHITGQKQNGNGVADPGVQVLPLLDSKGLEFPIVFMVGMAEGIFPSQSAVDLEEERRICYLGFTRARELLYLSYPQQFSGAMLQPSHFLIDARLMAALPMPQMVVHPEPAAVEQPPVVAPPAVAYEMPQQQYVQPAAYEVPQQQYMQPAAYEAPQQQYVEPAAYEVPQQQYVEPAAYEVPQQQYVEPAVYEVPQQQYMEPAAYEVPQQQYMEPAAYEVPQQQYMEPAAYEAPQQQYVEPVAHEVSEPEYIETVYEPAEEQTATSPAVEPIQAAYAQPEPYDPILDEILGEGAAAGTQLEPIHAPAEPAPAAAEPLLTAIEPVKVEAFTSPAVVDERTPQERSFHDEPLAEPFFETAAAVPTPQERSFHESEPVIETPAVAPAAAAEPELPAVSPEPAVAQPPTTSRSRPGRQKSVPQPEPIVEAAPEPVTPVAEPVKAAPEPVKAAPEPAKTTPEPVKATPEPIKPIQPVIVPVDVPAAPAAYSQPEQPAVDPFQIYSAESTTPQRSLQSLPKSKSTAAPTPAPIQPAEPEPVIAPPVVHQPPSQTPTPPPAARPAAPISTPAVQQPAAFTPAVPASLEQQIYQTMGGGGGFASPTSAQPTSFHAEPPAAIAQPERAPSQPAPSPHPVYPYSAHAHPTAAHQVPAHEITAGSPLCPSCHSALEANARFCSECGYSLPQRVPACPTCSAPLEATAKFCGECGVSLNAPMAGDSSQMSQQMVLRQDLKEKQSLVKKVWKMLEN